MSWHNPGMVTPKLEVSFVTIQVFAMNVVICAIYFAEAGKTWSQTGELLCGSEMFSVPGGSLDRNVSFQVNSEFTLAWPGFADVLILQVRSTEERHRTLRSKWPQHLSTAVTTDSPYSWIQGKDILKAFGPNL